MKRQAPPLSALQQPPLPIGHIPRDLALRQSLIWIANRAEGEPEAFGALWPDVERAIRWIYDQAIDPIVDREQEPTCASR